MSRLGIYAPTTYEREAKIFYQIAPENEKGEFELYSVAIRKRLDGQGEKTFRNSCGFFPSRQVAEINRDRLERLLNQSRKL